MSIHTLPLRGTRSLRRLAGAGALALGLPLSLAAQQDSKTSAIPRVMAAAEATNALRGGANPSVRPLTAGTRHTSALDANDPTLDDGSHVELWAIELQAGQQVTVTMRSRDFDTMLLMMQVDNTSYNAENDDFEEGSTDSRISFRAPATGVYAFLANSYEGGARGSYTIEAVVGGGPAGGQGGAMDELMGGGGSNTLSYGQTINGELTDSDRTLDDGSKYDEYTFQGAAGDRVVITMTSSSFDTYLALLSAGGERVAQNDDATDGDTNSQIVFTLPAAGRYTIVANSYEAGSFGAYALKLEKR